MHFVSSREVVDLLVRWLCAWALVCELPLSKVRFRWRRRKFGTVKLCWIAGIDPCGACWGNHDWRIRSCKTRIWHQCVVGDGVVVYCFFRMCMIICVGCVVLPVAARVCVCLCVCVLVFLCITNVSIAFDLLLYMWLSPPIDFEVPTWKMEICLPF